MNETRFRFYAFLHCMFTGLDTFRFMWRTFRVTGHLPQVKFTDVRWHDLVDEEYLKPFARYMREHHP